LKDVEHPATSNGRARDSYCSKARFLGILGPMINLFFKNQAASNENKSRERMNVKSKWNLIFCLKWFQIDTMATHS
jgi:hypothetical protein